MRHYLAVTDPKWFEFHRRHDSSQVIFWKPSQALVDATRGCKFFFLVKGRPRRICGRGTLAESEVAKIEEFWRKYDERLGHGTVGELIAEMNQKTSKQRGHLTTEDRVGFYVLTDVVYFARPIVPERSLKTNRTNVDFFAGIEFAQSIVPGKYISAEEARKLEDVGLRAAATHERPTQAERTTAIPRVPKITLIKRRTDGAAYDSRRGTESLIRTHFKDLGYSVRSAERADKGCDFVAEKAGKALRIKALTMETERQTFKLTPIEYRQMTAEPSAYVVCIALPGTARPPKLTLFEYSAGYDGWIDRHGRSLQIREEVSAILAIQSEDEE